MDWNDMSPNLLLRDRLLWWIDRIVVYIECRSNSVRGLHLGNCKMRHWSCEVYTLPKERQGFRLKVACNKVSEMKLDIIRDRLPYLCVLR